MFILQSAKRHNVSLRKTSGEADGFSGRNSTGSTQGCHKYTDIVDSPRFESNSWGKVPILKSSLSDFFFLNKPEWFKIILYLTAQNFYSNMFSNKGNIIFQKASQTGVMRDGMISADIDKSFFTLKSTYMDIWEQANSRVTFSILCNNAPRWVVSEIDFIFISMPTLLPKSLMYCICSLALLTPKRLHLDVSFILLLKVYLKEIFNVKICSPAENFLEMVFSWRRGEARDCR